jgi:hypothetical protein
VPAGRYRDVLSADEHELAGRFAVGELVEPHGLVLLERVSEGVAASRRGS